MAWLESVGGSGSRLAVKLLHGETDPRLERAGLTTTRTFGNLREHPAAWLLSLLRRCVTAGWATFQGGDRPVLVLTEDGRAVMRGERPARLRLPPIPVAAAARRPPASTLPGLIGPAATRDRASGESGPLAPTRIRAHATSSRPCGSTG